MENHGMLTVLANLRINDRERLQHLVDGVSLFDQVSDNWLINIRGAYREKSIEFLRKKLGEKAVFFDFLDDSREWITNSLDMLLQAKYNYVLIWNEDHLNVAPQDVYREIGGELEKFNVDYMQYSWWMFGGDRAFFDGLADQIGLKNGSYIDYVDMDAKKWELILRSRYPYFLISLCGIFRKDFLKKMMADDQKKLPRFFTKMIFKAMAVLTRFGMLGKEHKNYYYVINKYIFFNKLSRYSPETPFDLEKPATRTDMLPLRMALPKRELFACIDDDLKMSGYSLVSRGMYPFPKK